MGNWRNQEPMEKVEQLTGMLKEMKEAIFTREKGNGNIMDMVHDYVVDIALSGEVCSWRSLNEQGAKWVGEAMGHWQAMDVIRIEADVVKSIGILSHGVVEALFEEDGESSCADLESANDDYG